MKDKNRGNSDYNDRIKLVNEYLDTFGLARIKCMLGDREFIGKNWITWLEQKQIPYIVRIKENGQYITNKRRKMVKAASLFKELEVGVSKYLGKRDIGKIDTYWGHVTGLRTAQGQLVILLHSAYIEQPCQEYRKRWQIELMFKMMKKGGFDLEATHLTHPDRLDTLLAVVAISACFAYQIGLLVAKQYPPQVKKHGYKPFNIIRVGLDVLFEWIRDVLPHSQTSLRKNLEPFKPIFYQYFQRLLIFVM